VTVTARPVGGLLGSIPDRALLAQWGRVNRKGVVMPNWCANDMTVTGDLEELKRFRDAVTDEEGKISILQRLVPVPADCARSEFWGSKWGDCDTDTDGYDIFGMVLWFSSAWSPPVEGIRKVSALFPSLLFELQFEEGGMDFCGASVARAGESAVVEFSISGDTVGIDWSLDWDDQDPEAVSDAVNELKARAAAEALEELNANGGLWIVGEVLS